MAWKAAVISIQKSGREGRDMFERSRRIHRLSQAAAAIGEKIVPRPRAREHGRIDVRRAFTFDVYFWTFRSESFVHGTEYAITEPVKVDKSFV